MVPELFYNEPKRRGKLVKSFDFESYSSQKVNLFAYNHIQPRRIKYKPLSGPALKAECEPTSEGKAATPNIHERTTQCDKAECASGAVSPAFSSVSDQGSR